MGKNAIFLDVCLTQLAVNDDPFARWEIKAFDSITYDPVSPIVVQAIVACTKNQCFENEVCAESRRFSHNKINFPK